jgi:hypothetical protein
MGFAHRLGMLNAFLSEVRGASGVWNATGEECTAHWSKTFPAETHLRLEPSIWQDHPGSLS